MVWDGDRFYVSSGGSVVAKGSADAREGKEGCGEEGEGSGRAETEEEKLEPERTMEGLAESSEETNSLQAFRAVEKR